MDKKIDFIMVILVAVVLVSFFLPWVKVESQPVGMITKILTGKRMIAVEAMSAFQVPLLVNSNEARLAISVVKILMPDVKDADKKSFIVWIVPFLALVMLFASHFFGAHKWVHLSIAIIGGLIFIIGTYKLMNTDLNKLVLNVKIGIGLWLTLLAYLGIGINEAAVFVRVNSKNRAR